MTFEITMPQMGADMTEGTLIRWVKQVGDHVARGDILAEVETDKATVELEAFEAGDLLKQLVGEGEVVPVGEVIGLLGDASEAVPDIERKPRAETPARRTVERPAEPVAAAAQQESSPSARTTAVATPATIDDGRVRISPVARRMATEAGLDVHGLSGSGPDGRILRRDVEAAVAGRGAPAAAPAGRAEPSVQPPVPVAANREAPAAARPTPVPAPGEVTPLSKMRQAIARRMTQSKQSQPHYYLTLDIDMTAAMAFREQLNVAVGEGARVSVNDLIVKACALAIQKYPKFNAEYTDAGLKYHDRVNIDIGIALDEGLLAPAILDCDSKSLGRIAADAKDLIARAKSNRLRAEELEGTFTITNLGAYGVEMLIGIINPPQAAILGVGSVMPQPVVRDGQVVVRDVMKVALSADHRISDGAEGARFSKEIQALLENPVSLAL
ncbi:MAG: dihydrolipoamide acetyltransferase family protein [Tepidiformaceae bacterium]